MNVAIVLMTSAWLAGADCGTPCCAPAPTCCDTCDPCCEEEKKGLFSRLFGRFKKNDCCDPCATVECAPACEPTCECEKPKKERKRLFGKKKKDECCDPCADLCNPCDGCAAPAAHALPGQPLPGTIKVMPTTPGEKVPAPKDGATPKTSLPTAPAATPTSSPKPLELGSSPY